MGRDCYDEALRDELVIKRVDEYVVDELERNSCWVRYEWRF